ncbi:MAG TPA: ATP-binding protein [Thermoanaerobaculia bacterium]|nr:ATP-binding protein [Thermoanaerobaculia bacterium]
MRLLYSPGLSVTDESLLLTALHVGRMIAFDWQLDSDRVLRLGDSRHVLGIDEKDVGDSASAYFQLVHPDDRQPMRDAIARLTPEQPELVHDYRLLLPHGGEVRWIQDSARAEFAADGALVRLRGLARDVTPEKEAEGRLTLLASVSEMIGAIEEPAELLYAVSRAVGEQLQVRRALFTEIDVEADRGVVRRDYCRGVPSVAGVYKVTDYAEGPRRELQAGRVVVNCDSKIDPRTAEQYEKTYAAHGERAYVAVPLLRDGRWVAELWISDDVPRQWNEQDVALLQSVAERVWTAVEKLRMNAALRESEGRMQFVGERANVGYWYWDVPSDQLIWSQVCRRLFGIEDDAPMSYARFLEVVHPDDRAFSDAAVRQALSGVPSSDYDIEYRVVLPDGTLRWIQAKGSATRMQMAGIAIDVTHRKALEREREELLARERRLRAAADEASIAKDYFLASLSHELRTPMTTILGWSSFLATIGTSDEATLQKGIRSIEDSSRVQARLIDDLLDVSRIVTGKLTLDVRRFDLAAVIREAMEAVSAAAAERSLQLSAAIGEEPVWMTGDAMRMQQVASNLLSNAVKFTNAGGRVHVTLRERDETIELSVRDTGIGISPDFLPHVFERFRQGDDGPSRRYGGLGLGLSIVRHIVELHGGTVEAMSEGAGRGAEFRVRLPLTLTNRPGDPSPSGK